MNTFATCECLAWRGVWTAAGRAEIWVPFLIVSAVQVLVLLLVTGFHLVPGVAPNLWYLSVVVAGALALLLLGGFTPSLTALVLTGIWLLAKSR